MRKIFGKLILIVILIVIASILIKFINERHIKKSLNIGAILYTAKEVETNFAKTNDERVLEALDKNMAQAYATKLGSANSIDVAYEMATNAYNSIYSKYVKNLISMELIFENNKIYLIECKFETKKEDGENLAII